MARPSTQECRPERRDADMVSSVGGQPGRAGLPAEVPEMHRTASVLPRQAMKDLNRKDRGSDTKTPRTVPGPRGAVIGSSPRSGKKCRAHASSTAETPGPRGVAPQSGCWNRASRPSRPQLEPGLAPRQAAARGTPAARWVSRQPGLADQERSQPLARKPARSRLPTHKHPLPGPHPVGHVTAQRDGCGAIETVHRPRIGVEGDR